MRFSHATTTQLKEPQRNVCAGLFSPVEAGLQPELLLFERLTCEAVQPLRLRFYFLGDLAEEDDDVEHTLDKSSLFHACLRGVRPWLPGTKWVLKARDCVTPSTVFGGINIRTHHTQLWADITVGDTPVAETGLL